MAGAGQVNGRQANGESQRGDDFEVNQALDAHAAHALQVSVAGNASYQCRKN